MTFNDHMICKGRYGMLPLIVDCGKKKYNSMLYTTVCVHINSKIKPIFN